MHILVTGASGFLGRRLIAALLAGPEGLPPVSRIVAADLAECPIADPRVDSRTGSVTDPAFVKSLVTPDVRAVCHLAAVVSGEAEADFDLGMQVNVDATRIVLEACRGLGTAPRVVFASTIAVFGGPLPTVVPEDMAVRPQSSYGSEKAIAEHLVLEYSRRGFIDGIVCRIPTVAVRPGKPNAAMSSFVSGIIREPLAGVESLCPVPLDTRLWVSAPETVAANLVHAVRIPGEVLDGRRTVNLPGLSVTPAEMLASLERLGGAAARALVRVEPDPRMASIVCSWPGAFDVARPLRLGFRGDASVDEIVAAYVRSEGAGG